MVVSLVVGALASTAAASGSAKMAGLSATGLAGVAGLAGKAVPHAGLVAASLQPHLAHLAPTYIRPLSNLIGPYHGALPNAGFVPYFYNHTLYGASWIWPYQPPTVPMVY